VGVGRGERVADLDEFAEDLLFSHIAPRPDFAVPFAGDQEIVLLC
jgi:hypothetical protein